MYPKPVQTTWRRIESKYLIDHELAHRIRAQCRTILPQDPYSASQPTDQYPVRSIYLDSPDGQLLQSTLDRQPTRLKLRVRTYRALSCQNTELPAFLEIKRKSHGAIHKTRAKRSAAEARNLLSNGHVFHPRSAALDATAASNASSTNEFLKMRHHLRARPVIGVFYTREAYESNSGDGVRISFARNLHYGVLDCSKEEPDVIWFPVTMRAVILEIKFTNTFPFWVHELVRRSELARRGVCKFVICLQAARRLDANISETRFS